ncbi:MAG: hypothetical protein K0U36_03730 [Alphaproteobacteria bacterium]|nr:hypothetical protein [Alphaproteobacteria bacterium]
MGQVTAELWRKSWGKFGFVIATLVVVVGCSSSPDASGGGTTSAATVPAIEQSVLEGIKRRNERTNFPALESCPLSIAPIAEEYSNIFLSRLRNPDGLLLPRFSREYIRLAVGRCEETILFSDDKRFLFYLSVALFANGEYDRALEFYQLVGSPYDFADSPWLHLYGMMQVYGLGGTLDVGLGYEFIQAAAANGFVPALVNLGDFHLADAYDIPLRPAYSLDLYREATRQRYATAAQRIGYMHEEGRYVTQSRVDAQSWYATQDRWTSESLSPLPSSATTDGEARGTTDRALPTSAYFHYVLPTDEK